MNKAIDAIRKAAQNMAARVGVTSQFTANLGKGDGTGTIIYADDLSRRMVWCHEPGESGGSRKIFLAVLAESAGIPFMNDPRMEGMEVRIGYPPGASQMHVLGMAISAYYGTSGQTVQDQVTQTAIRPPADAIVTLRVEATYPATTSIQVGGPFLFIRPSDWSWKSFSGGIYDLGTRISALTAGQHQLCLICLDPETSTLVDLVNTASSATDTLPQRASFGLADILGFTIRNYVPLGAVYLYIGQASAGISESDIYRTYPTRFMFQPAGLNKFNATAAPTTGDDANDGYTVGSRWIDTTNDITYVCTDSTVGAAVWKQTSNATVYYQTVQDEGTPVTQRATINFIGSGVSVADNSGSSRTDVTISSGSITVEEADGAPTVASVTKIKFSNGTVTDDGGGVVSVNNASASSLTVKEIDGTPSVSSVTEIKVTNGKLTDNGSGSVTLDLTGSAGGTVYVQTNGGRLTLTSGTAVTTADVTAAGTLYWTPYLHNQIALYDGASAWSILTFSELSLSLSGFTSALPYDIWVYDNSGTAALDSTAWTNATTRATALTTVNGVYCKTGATTRRYLGTIYMSATSQTEDSVSKRFVFNYVNRTHRKLRVADTTNSWTYNGTSFRSLNNSTANRVEFMIGISDQLVDLLFVQYWNNGGGTIGIGLDSTTATADLVGYSSVASASGTSSTSVRYMAYPGLGYHYLQLLERSTGNTLTFFGDNGDATLWQTGALGGVWA